MSNSMTNEEAIRILDPDCKEVWKAYDGKDMERCNDACRVAVKALKKQIPKKPLIIKHDKDIKLGSATWKAGVPIYKCPRCNGFISRSNKFCTDCGQALDWRDE